MLSKVFKERIDRCNDIAILEAEIKVIYKILFRDFDFRYRLEMIEKINYITKRINDIEYSP